MIVEAVQTQSQDPVEFSVEILIPVARGTGLERFERSLVLGWLRDRCANVPQLNHIYWSQVGVNHVILHETDAHLAGRLNRDSSGFECGRAVCMKTRAIHLELDTWSDFSKADVHCVTPIRAMNTHSYDELFQLRLDLEHVLGGQLVQMGTDWIKVLGQFVFRAGIGRCGGDSGT